MSEEKKKLPVKREFSAGGCVYKKLKGLDAEKHKSLDEVVWLIGKHSGYHKWVLPKGMIEKGESAEETAVRETEEEMGVVGRVVGDKPVHKEEYWFVAELKGTKAQRHKSSKAKPVRRVKIYQEDPEFEESKAEKIRVFKTVNFYLMEYVSGDPKDHDWEMEDAGWFDYEEAMEKLAFEGERMALRLAMEKVKVN